VWCLGVVTGVLRSFPLFPSLFPLSLRSVPMVLLAEYLWRVPDDFGFAALALLVVLFLCLPFGLGASSCNTPVSQSLVEVPDDFRDIRK
jgi:hypothetical protein